VSEISADIQKGSCFVITGRNGSGKSTLMNTLMGLQAPQAGKVLIDGHDLFQLSKADKKDFFKKTGFAQQQLHLRPLDTVRKVLNHDSADTIQRERIMKFISLETRAKSLVKELSYAEKRRLDLARSLVHQPKLVIWDEPFLGMDELWTVQFIQALRELQDLGTTLIISSTHIGGLSTLKDFHTLLLK
jgi:ABC-type multidrug transport system ATPase subunit